MRAYDEAGQLRSSEVCEKAYALLNKQSCNE